MLPLLYHTHHNRHMEDIPFWLSLVKAQSGAVLELGCGTGRIFLPLMQSFVKEQRLLVGLDSDLNMLHFLKALLPNNLAAKAQLVQMDMSTFHFETNFDLILLPCNTYSTLSDTNRYALLQRIHQHLGSRGLFAVSIPNPQAFIELPDYGEPEVEETFTHPKDGLPVQVSSYWEKDQKYFTLYWQYDHLLPNGSIEQTVTRTRHIIQPVNTYLDEFTQAGLSISQTFGDFDRSPYDKDSPVLIMLAKL